MRVIHPLLYRTATTLAMGALAVGTLAIGIGSATSWAGDWPQFRGPQSNSVTDDAQPPATWNDGENIAWKVDLPGRGPSSPIVVGDRVIVTCSSGVNQDRLHVLCFDAGAGKQLWERQFWATGRTLSHPSSANAAPTPASDGDSIFAFFSSNDLICLDLEGNLKWLRGLAYDFPKAGNDVGMSSSPLVIGDTVVAQVECQGDSFVTGVDKKTGEPLWRIERPREASWASPVAVARGKARRRPGAGAIHHEALGARSGDRRRGVGVSREHATQFRRRWWSTASCTCHRREPPLSGRVRPPRPNCCGTNRGCNPARPACFASDGRLSW